MGLEHAVIDGLTGFWKATVTVHLTGDEPVEQVEELLENVLDGIHGADRVGESTVWLSTEDISVEAREGADAQILSSVLPILSRYNHIEPAVLDGPPPGASRRTLVLHSPDDLDGIDEVFTAVPDLGRISAHRVDDEGNYLPRASSTPLQSAFSVSREAHDEGDWEPIWRAVRDTPTVNELKLSYTTVASGGTEPDIKLWTSVPDVDSAGRIAEEIRPVVEETLSVYDKLELWAIGDVGSGGAVIASCASEVSSGGGGNVAAALRDHPNLRC